MKGGSAVSRSAIAAETDVSPGSASADAPLPPRSGGLTDESLSGLFEHWQRHGDQRAREALVGRFMPLARSLARRYVGTQEPIDDLTQVACLGLIKAIDRFDVTRGNRFPAYAVPTILGELRRHFRDTAWAVHVPRSGQERAMKVERASELLTSKHGHSPTIGEIAEYLELGQGEVLEAMQVSKARGSVSLDAPRPGGDERETESRGESIGVEDDDELVEDGSAVAHALSLLAPRERRVLRLRFEQEMTQSEIAAEIGLSQMQISRVLRRSLEKMRAIAADEPD
jgi:RNA polymerase sigma-B factor